MTTLFVKELKKRALRFSHDRNISRIYEHDSPIYDILNTSNKVSLYEACMKMIHRDHFLQKLSGRNWFGMMCGIRRMGTAVYSICK